MIAPRSRCRHAHDRRRSDRSPVRQAARRRRCGAISHLPRVALPSLFRPGDLFVANDAATLPASLHGVHCPTGEPIEARLAGWLSFRDPTRFVAVVFGAGDHRMLTEDRPLPSQLSASDRLEFGPLIASVERLLDHPRLVRIRFAGSPRA